MKRINCLLFFCFLSQCLLAQITVSTNSKNYNFFQKQLLEKPQSINFIQQIELFTLKLNQNEPIPLWRHSPTRMPLAYAYKDLAFFCKIEVQLEKAAKLPVKFRLGSVDYVDFLEGKRDSY